MGTTLATLSPPRGARHSRKRVGRGPGSGHGTTAAKGQKGQKSRSGASPARGFEGGQMPLQRRLPKRGFKNPFRVAYDAVNIGRLAAAFEAGTTITIDDVREKGLVPRASLRFKVLGEGELGHALTIKAQACSKSAKAKIEQAGGQVEIIAEPVRQSAKPQRQIAQGATAEA